MWELAPDLGALIVFAEHRCVFPFLFMCGIVKRRKHFVVYNSLSGIMASLSHSCQRI